MNFILSSVFLVACISCAWAISPLLMQEYNLTPDDYIKFQGKMFLKKSVNLTERMPVDRLTRQTQSKTYSQCLDHFTTGGCTKTWAQRYWTSSEFYKTGGPLFFMLGGENAMDGFIDSFIWRDYAKRYGAYLLVVEHRFYGQSFPIPPSNRTAAAMKYLTSRQALEDYSKFLTWFKTQQGIQKAKVVAFGGSYPGNLAAWFRQKYPKQVNVAVAASSPVEAKFDFQEYIRTVSTAIYQVNSNCYWKIYNTFDCMENLVNYGSCSTTYYTSRDQLPPALHQCYKYYFEDDLWRQSFFSNVGYAAWASNNPGTQNEPHCTTFTSQNTMDPIDDYGDFLVQSGKAPDCTKQRRGFAYDVMQEVPGDSDDSVSWIWQTCNEFAYFQTADKMYRMLGYEFSYGLDITRCQQMFPDAKFTETSIRTVVDNTNAFYKAKNYDGTCTIFSNGSWDPWHPLGITQQNQTSASNTVIFIPYSEHCEDMQTYSNNRYARQGIIAAQTRISNQIGVYLNSTTCSG